MTPTPEQAAIVSAATDSDESLLISALAGAAKTSTLELVCKALPNTPILSLAFNKRIADEMVKRLPQNVVAKTLNSIGHSVWQTAIGRRLKIEKGKSFDILKELTAKRKSKDFDFSATLRAISAAKLAGLVPSGLGKSLASPEDFFADFEDDADEDLVDAALRESIRQSYAGLCDFDDQVYMSTLFGGTFPRFPLVLVDEAQDLSPLNHAMLDRLVTKRLIAVGDPYQSIYAFRGADTASMSRLARRFACREMTLSISFRCPQSVVELARKRAPRMQWPEWAILGEVHSPTEWQASAIPDGAAIICRNNAPLFKCAMQLLRAGRGVKLVGTDLGPQLIRALKRLGEGRASRAEALAAVDRWEEEQLRKKRRKAALADRADCLRVFLSFGDTLGDAIAYADHIFGTSGPIQLLSGHKAKGLEWDTVYFLNEFLIPSKYAEGPEELEQEENVRYVITTRAKRALWFVDLEGLRC